MNKVSLLNEFIINSLSLKSNLINRAFFKTWLNNPGSYSKINLFVWIYQQHEMECPGINSNFRILICKFEL